MARIALEQRGFAIPMPAHRIVLAARADADTLRRQDTDLDAAFEQACTGDLTPLLDTVRPGGSKPAPGATRRPPASTWPGWTATSPADPPPQAQRVSRRSANGTASALSFDRGTGECGAAAGIRAFSEPLGYSSEMSWEIILAPEVHDWFLGLDDLSASLVRDAVELLAERGPALGRPLADRISRSRLHNLKELRPGSAGRTEMRILYIFDTQRQAVLLVAGDKSGNWSRCYDGAIKLAEDRYERYLATPAEEIE